MNEIKKIGTQLVFSSLKVRGCVKFSFGNLIRISIETETIFSYLYTYNSYLCAYKLVYPFKVMFMHAINSMRLRSTFYTHATQFLNTFLNKEKKNKCNPTNMDFF